jgi:hypothetical protein
VLFVRRSAPVVHQIAISPLLIVNALRLIVLPPTIRLPREDSMPFSIRLIRHFPVECAISYSVGSFEGIGTVWNLSCSGWGLSGAPRCDLEKASRLTDTPPHE